jgi:hypothetical protein
MAILVTAADAALDAAATWQATDLVSGANSIGGTTAVVLGTTPGTGTDSTTWGSDNSEVDGILLQLAAVGGTTGTLTVILRQVSPASDLATVTIDIAQLPSSGDGWFFVKFASPVGLANNRTHTVRVYRSVGSSSVSLLTNGTTNWNRVLRTTSTLGGPPVAADVLFILGEFTGAGAPTARTVDMTHNTTTAYGDIWIGVGGTLRFGSSASSTYNLRIAGNLYVGGGGTFTMGTVASPIPATSTATLELFPTADGGFGLLGNGIITGQGAPRTYDRARLAADAAGAATSLTSDVSTGWVATDEIAIGQTYRSGTGQSEKRTISNVVGTTITVPAITNAHHGTSPTQAYLILLTRNVRIRSASTTYVSYVNFKRWATVDFDWVEFSYLGENATGKRGVECDTIEGSVNLNRCSFHDCEDFGLYLGTAATSTGITVTNCVAFNLASVTGPAVTNIATSGTWAITGNIFMQVSSASACINVRLYDLGGTFTDNVMIGGYNGLIFDEATTNPGTFGTLEIICTSNAGIYFRSDVCRLSSSTVTVYRCAATGGIRLDAGTHNTFTGGASSRIRWVSCAFAGDASYSTYNGVLFGGFSANYWVFEDCDLGVAAGSGNNARVAHTISDVGLTTGYHSIDAIFTACDLASTTEVSGQENLSDGASIRLQRRDQVVGAHQTFMRAVTLEPDATVYHTAAPSLKMIPVSATEQGESEAREIPIDAAGIRTITVWIRKTSAYNGAQPRLRVKKNLGAGSNFSADITLDTATVGTEIWEQLSGTTPVADDNTALEAFVDCDGTAGAINVDDWAVV